MASLVTTRADLSGQPVLPPIGGNIAATATASRARSPPAIAAAAAAAAAAAVASPLSPAYLQVNPDDVLDAAATEARSGFAANSSSGGGGSSSRLTGVEAQRVVAVLQEAQRKAVLVGLVPDAVDRRVSAVFAAATVAVLTDYRATEMRYNVLRDRKIAGEKVDEVSIPVALRYELGLAGWYFNHGAELQNEAQSLRSATRALCRHFLQNPGVFSKLRMLHAGGGGAGRAGSTIAVAASSPAAIAGPPAATVAMARFEGLLQEVKKIFHDRLATSVEEERARAEQIAAITAKEQKTSNEVRMLRVELDKARRERATEVNKRNEVIRRLKEELRDIKQQAEETTKRLESRSKQKEDQELQQAQEKESAIQQEVARLRLQLSETETRNREEEAQWRKKKFKIESEVENWIHKYDQDMEERQSELEDITAIYVEEKAQLDELQERFAELQVEHARIMEERRVEQEARREEERQLRRRHGAATLIQAVFRGYRVRRDLRRRKAADAAAAGKKGGAKKRK
ncbi:hypothetical protein HK405_004031 [Cladochytrium tenue]|nr:hypothetical protein HK405_004031 [Cladochytrium tenue]